MGLIYIYQTACIRSNSSVQSKIVSQINAANSLGLECTGWFFTQDQGEFPTHENIIYYQVPIIESGYFRNLRQTKLTYKTIMQVLQNNLLDSDKLYMRYWGVSFALYQLVKAYKKRITFNHVCAEIKEIAMYKSDGNSIASKILGNLEYKWIPIILDYTIGRLIRRHAGKAVVNSIDIASYQRGLAFGKYACEIISDAVDANSFPIANLNFDHKKINMFFLKGASGSASYNGLDRLINGIMQYKGNYQLNLTIIGNDLAYEKKLIQDLNADKFVGFKTAMSQIQLNDEVNNYQIAVSQLGVHRKGIRSNSTIKSREYFARGIPFIFAHHDPDLSESELARQFCYEYAGDESVIDCNEIVSFVEKIYSVNNFGAVMHQFAVENLDYSGKTKTLYRFANN